MRELATLQSESFDGGFGERPPSDDAFVRGHKGADNRLSFRGVLFGHIVDHPKGWSALQSLGGYKNNLTVCHTTNMLPNDIGR